MNEETHYKKLKEILNHYENHISLRFYEGFSEFLDDDYCKKTLNKAKDAHEKLLIYIELLALYTSIVIARIQRLIEEHSIGYDRNLLLINDKTVKSMKQSPENYTF